MKTCQKCLALFEVTDADRVFYDKVSPVFSGVKYAIPEPTFCPDCRAQRRLIWRNERKLYKRKCDLCQKEIISMYSAEVPFPVYCNDCIWSDRWDPLSYGQAFDFSKPFFEQFHTLYNRVPKPHLAVLYNENSEYANSTWKSKNVYLSADIGYGENVAYSTASHFVKDLFDSARCKNSELLYECLECDNCYSSLFLEKCENCSDSAFLFDCKGCSHCLLSTNLRQKQYHILNKPVTKEVFEETWKELQARGFSLIQEWKEKFRQLTESALHRENYNVSCEHCSGNRIVQSKNCEDCFDVFRSQDLKYCTDVDSDCTDSMDMTGAAEGDLLYEGLAVAGHRNLFSHYIEAHDCYYSFYCFSQSKSLFGCSTAHKKEYCILNKQYTKEEYEALVPKIIEYMRKTDEWGEFIPISISPFGYNETTVSEYFPLIREEALAKGFKWSDYEAPKPQAAKVISAENMKKLPDSIDQIPDDVLNWALTCEVSGKLYKIQAPELAFYRKMKLPIPRRHPDQRHADRMTLRNPRHLWKRHCAECDAGIETTYAPERPEKVLCEVCYLKAVV